MAHSEQPAVEKVASVEKEQQVVELYDYKTVTDALHEHEINDDDVANLGGVVVHWDYSIPSWNNIKDIRQARAELDVASEKVREAAALLVRAEQLLTQEHWDQALEVQRSGNKILASHPGVFVCVDKNASIQFVIETLLLTSDHDDEATLYISGQGHTIPHTTGLDVYIDITKLASHEQTAFRAYAEALEIEPKNKE